MNHIVNEICARREERVIEEVCRVLDWPSSSMNPSILSNGYLFDCRVKYYLDTGKWELNFEGKRKIPRYKVKGIYINVNKIEQSLYRGYLLNLSKKGRIQLSRDFNDSDGPLLLKIEPIEVLPLVPDPHQSYYNQTLLEKYEFFIR